MHTASLQAEIGERRQALLSVGKAEHCVTGANANSDVELLDEMFALRESLGDRADASRDRQRSKQAKDRI